MANNSGITINPAQFASRRAKFFGSDARLTVVFIIVWLLFKSWITFFLFVAIFVFSFILEYNDIEFLNFLKKIRMFLTGKDKKDKKNTY